MSKPSPKARVVELRDLLEHASRAYYVDAVPEISDIEFDRLLTELIRLENEHPELVDPTSPTQRVGSEVVDQLHAVAHRLPMLSIDNTYTPSEVETWYRRVCDELRTKQPTTPRLFEAEEVATPALYVEPKVDGVAMSLVYQRGKLIHAVTRGDGSRGDDVLHNVKRIKELPTQLSRRGGSNRSDWPIPDLLEVRGEIYLTHDMFERVNQERAADGDDLFMNPRNAVAGAVRSLDSSGFTRLRPKFLAHGQGRAMPNQFTESHSSYIAELRRFDIPTSPWGTVCQTIPEVLEYISEFAHKRLTIGYPTDGVVVRIDSFDFQKRLGSTSKSPRWIIAYKYPAERKTTVLVRVDPQVGKSGKITPRAVMEPVLLAGTVVKHASLHNYGRVRDASTNPDVPDAPRTDIRIGDTVYVEKAGEIIPYVAGVVIAKRPRGAEKIDPPTKCPECNGPVELDPPEAMDDPKLETSRSCVNPECPAQIREKIIWFAGRRQMDIEGLGEKTVDQIRATTLPKGDERRIAAGVPDDAKEIPLGTFADVFRLKEHRDKLLQLERMGEKKVDNLLEGIEQAKSRGLGKVLAGMGIRHVGESTSKALARQFKDLDDLLAAEEPRLRPKTLKKDEAARLGLPIEVGDREETGLGNDTARAVYDYLHSKVATRTFKDLREQGVDLSSQDYRLPTASGAKTAEGPFAGKTIVLTGTLESYQRDDLKNLLEKLGAKISGSVSSKTHLLIAGAEAGSKLSKAQELEVTIWDEAKLLEALKAAGGR